MENVFYDYKKNKYEVLDSVGQNDWQLYLLRDANGQHFMFDTKNEELLKSAKPLRSVFNRYGSDVMYDIPKFGEAIEDIDLLAYEEKKYAVITYDVMKKQKLETAEKIKQAKQSGWAELNIDTAQYALTNDGLEIVSDGKHFDIKARSKELDFNSMSEIEINEYVKSWITCYNNSVGDLAQSQTAAECDILAGRMVAGWVEEGKTSSLDLTTKLVTNLDMSDRFEGYQSDKAFAVARKILNYMSDSSIPFASTPTLMGDCNDLEYDIYAVMFRHQSYNENFREEAMAQEMETKALSFLEEKKVLPLNVATDDDKSYTGVVEIPNPDNIDLKAYKFMNSVIGAESYDIILKSKYPYFDVRPRLIGSCNQKTLNSLLGTQEGAGNTKQYKSLSAAQSPVKGQTAANKGASNPNKQWQM